MEKGHKSKGFHFTFDNYYTNIHSISYSGKIIYFLHVLFLKKKIFNKRNKKCIFGEKII